MKKIILVAIAILMTGIFTGCASTSVSNSTTKNNQWDGEKYSPEEVIEEINSFLRKPVITKADIEHLNSIKFVCYDLPHVTHIDPNGIQYLETKRTDYTGRIINKTDKKVTFLIGNGNCGSYNQDKWYFFDVEPGETGYFVLPYAISQEIKYDNRYTMPFIKIWTLPSGDMKGEWNMIYCCSDSFYHDYCILKGDRRDDNNWYYLPLLNETFKNHSLEMIYTTDEEFGLNEVRFVKAFEYSWED